jgi:hypothetical protein
MHFGVESAFNNLEMILKLKFNIFLILSMLIFKCLILISIVLG